MILQENPIKEIEMNTTYLATFQDQKDKYGNLVKGEIAGRYESRNILIQLEGDSSGKEYFLTLVHGILILNFMI